MELNKKNEEILNSAEYDEFGKGLFDFITKDETSENKEETLVGQIGTGDKMSQDKLGQDKMSQDKLGQETKTKASESLNSNEFDQHPRPTSHVTAQGQNVPGQIGTGQNVPGQIGTGDKMSQENMQDSQNVPGQIGTGDKMSQELKSPNTDEAISQYIVSHYLFTRALIDYSLTLDLKPNAKLIMLHFLSQGIIAADFTQEDLALKLAMSRKTVMRAVKDLVDGGYIIKPEEQPHKLTRISFIPVLELFIADKGLTYLDVTSDVKRLLESTPICSNPNTEIGYSLNPNISWDKLGQEALVMYSRFSIKPLTYYTEGSRDKMSQDKDRIPTGIKITNRQDIHLERIYFWGYLFNFTETRMTEATLEKLLEYIPINDETHTEELTTYERNVIYTHIVNKARQPWNYLLSAIKEEYYKSKFTPEITEKYTRLREILFKLMRNQTNQLKNEILKIGYDVIRELLDTFEFGYKVEKGEIDLIKAAEKIAVKVKSIESSYTEFKIAHKINKYSLREEVKLMNKLKNASDT